jgi:putative ABC transport system permease protein
LRELRHHPGRYLATLIAIAISVGFMAAASVVTATEQNAMARQGSIAILAADLVIDVTEAPESIKSNQISTVLRNGIGIDEYQHAVSSSFALEYGGESAFITVSSLPPDSMRWSSLRDGAWPSGTRELALNQSALDNLGAEIGAQVTLSFGLEATFVITGVTNDPSTLIGDTGWVIPEALAGLGYSSTSPYGDWIVSLDDGVAADTGAADETTSYLKAAFDQLGVIATIEDAATAADQRSQELTGDVDVFKYVLWIFAAIAMVVGMITISNTFTILLTQRRRQIGLVRAVGATSGQVRRSTLVEAVLLGLIGALLGLGLAVGLAALVGVFTGSIFWGLVLPWRDLALSVGLGVLIVVLASFLPIRRTTRVRPIEALRPVSASAGREKRVSIVRAVLCGLLVAGGVTFAVLALNGGTNAVVFAVAGAALITLGVLFGAVLFVPSLIRLFGRFVGLFGPTARLAAANAARNPKRSATTATALMLAVGLIVTLQLGSASMRETALARIDQTMPVDLMIAPMSYGGGDAPTPAIPANLQADIAAIAGVTATLPFSTLECAIVRTVISDGSGVVIPGGNGSVSGSVEPGGEIEISTNLTLAGYDARFQQITPSAPAAIPAGEIWLSEDMANVYDEGAPINVTCGAVTRQFAFRGTDLADTWGAGYVAPEILAQLGAPVPNTALIIDVADRGEAIDIVTEISQLLDDHAGAGDIPENAFTISGAVFEASVIEQALNIILLALTGLLAVAVLIAIVGVANTLTLSVIERTRESALLRALGLQRSQLRRMLLIEALLLVGVGALVGVIAGVFFGWLGSSAMVVQLEAEGIENIDTRLAVDWGITLGLLAILLLAAALASILPGRRAAKATPVEALADVG